MPQILVTTDAPTEADNAVLYQERVSVNDLDSDHGCAQLVERLGWALLDADELEHRTDAERPFARRE